jgi:hypothetical protein
MADGERSDFSQPLWGLCHIEYGSARSPMRWGRAPNTHSAVERSQGDTPCELGTAEARAARAYRGRMDDTPRCEHRQPSWPSSGKVQTGKRATA